MILRTVATAQVEALEQMLRDSMPALASVERIDFDPTSRLVADVRLAGGLSVHVEVGVQPNGTG